MFRHVLGSAVVAALVVCSAPGVQAADEAGQSALRSASPSVTVGGARGLAAQRNAAPAATPLAAAARNAAPAAEGSRASLRSNSSDWAPRVGQRSALNREGAGHSGMALRGMSRLQGGARQPLTQGMRSRGVLRSGASGATDVPK